MACLLSQNLPESILQHLSCLSTYLRIPLLLLPQYLGYCPKSGNAGPSRTCPQIGELKREAKVLKYSDIVLAKPEYTTFPPLAFVQLWEFMPMMTADNSRGALF